MLSNHDVKEKAVIQENVEEFQKEVRVSMAGAYQPHQVYNADQMGVQLEMPSTRTLSFTGEKITIGLIKSHNAVTHSYTVQPTISAAGELTTPVFLCLKEPSGKISEGMQYYAFNS